MTVQDVVPVQMSAQARKVQKPLLWKTWKQTQDFRNSSIMEENFRSKKMLSLNSKKQLLREASSNSLCLSSPEHVQVVVKHLTLNWSHSCLVTECTLQMLQDVPLSGVTLHRLHHTQQTLKDRDLHGLTHCSKITLSLVMVCFLHRELSVMALKQKLKLL